MNLFRILLLEEEYLISEDIRLLLTDNGYKVELALSPSDIFEKVVKFSPHLVILGAITRGHYDEIRIAEMIQNEVSTPIQMLFLQSRPISSDIRVDSYALLEKPFKNEELLRTIQLLLKK